MIFLNYLYTKVRMCLEDVRALKRQYNDDANVDKKKKRKKKNVSSLREVMFTPLVLSLLDSNHGYIFFPCFILLLITFAGL